MKSKGRFRNVRAVYLTNNAEEFELLFSSNREGKHLWAEAYQRGTLSDKLKSDDYIETMTIEEPRLPSG